jgi:hypothetical protein
MPLHRREIRHVVCGIPPIGCLCCGSRRDGQVRIDKHSKPYFHCMACNETGVFAYSIVSQELIAAFAFLVADGRIDFDAAFERGRGIWRQWLGGVSESAVTVAEASAKEVRHAE